MFGRILTTALAAGVTAGIFAWGAHLLMVVPLIEEADALLERAIAGDAPPGGEGRDFVRYAYMLIAEVVTAVGFAFILTGAVALSRRQVDWRRGIMWGLAGFATFFAAPSLGLPPELPGTIGPELLTRQAWWVATMACTAAGLGLIFLAPGVAAKTLGAVLIVTPHVIGAPAHEFMPSPVPAGMAAEFAVASLIISALFWMMLGGLVGYFQTRSGPP